MINSLTYFCWGAYIEVTPAQNDTIETIAKRFNLETIKLAKYNKIPVKQIFTVLKRKQIIIIPLSFIQNSQSNESDPKQPEVTLTEELVNNILGKAGIDFKEGLTALQDNRRSDARLKFDKSVEVFLMSGINLSSKSNSKIRDCFNQLIETVYRIEFPNEKQVSNIRSLSLTCGWKIDNKVSDEIAQLVLKPQTSETPTDSSAVVNLPNDNTKTFETTQGFVEQKFKRSPLDDLSILELTETETQVKTTTYQRPTTYQRSTTSVQSNVYRSVTTVKAQSGDTVAKLGARYGVSAIDVANLNGFKSINSKITAGREVKIPAKSTYIPYQKPNEVKPLKQNPNTNTTNIGNQPIQQKDGKVPVVMAYFNEFFNDPYSMRFVRWSKIEKKTYLGKEFWAVQVKFRAKNSFGAYVLSEMIFYIQKNKVITSQKLY